MDPHWTRRGFLECIAAAGAATAARMSPGWSGEPAVLVVVQARGGWDALSMLVPCEDPAYRAHRLQLALRAEHTLPLAAGSDLRLHPSLAALRRLFDRGQLAFVQNVSHPHPNLSHFESEDKWHTADPVGGRMRTGWLGRFLARTTPEAAVFPALTVADAGSEAFAGVTVAAIRRIQDLSVPLDSAARAALLRHWDEAARGRGGTLALVAETMTRELRASDALLAGAREYRPRAAYSASPFAHDLQTVARLVVGGARTRVFHLSLPGFDTHTLQCENRRPTFGHLADLLRDLAENLTAFLEDLQAQGCGRHVLLFAYSEFGRAARENGHLGTEHGHGGMALLAGMPVRGGLHGLAPDLAAIEPPTPDTAVPWCIPHDRLATDYRRIYAAILESFLRVPSEPILGGRFAPLGVL